MWRKSWKYLCYNSFKQFYQFLMNLVVMKKYRKFHLETEKKNFNEIQNQKHNMYCTLLPFQFHTFFCLKILYFVHKFFINLYLNKERKNFSIHRAFVSFFFYFLPFHFEQFFMFSNHFCFFLDKFFISFCWLLVVYFLKIVL